MKQSNKVAAIVFTVIACAITVSLVIVYNSNNQSAESVQYIKAREQRDSGQHDVRPDQTVVRGPVVSVISGGLFSAGGLLVDDTDFGIVFIEGNFPDVVDGQKVSVTAIPNGVFHYAAASGASKTVRAYREP
jgi:hypothetical protein